MDKPIELPTENFSVTIPNFMDFVGVVLVSVEPTQANDILVALAAYALQHAPETRRVALVEEIAHAFNLGFYRVESSKPVDDEKTYFWLSGSRSVN